MGGMMRRRTIREKNRFGAENLVARIRQAREKIAQAADWLATPVLFAGFVFFLGLALWELSKEDSNLEWMKFYAYLVGGIVLIWQVRISNRRATALEKTAALGEKGNITERFKNAVEHLGNASESVRMGGIYALYHVARESSEYVDTVKEILRSHANAVMENPEYAKREKPSNEIAAILNVLFPVTRQPAEVLFKNMDISNWRLRGANLQHHNLRGVQGTNINLSEANLWGANLSDAFLRTSNFSGADFGGANLSGAYLHEVDLSKATMVRAGLSGARLEQVNFSGAHMVHVDLSGACILAPNFSGAMLYGAHLSGMRDISVEHLLGVSSLRGAKLDDHIRQEILRRKPNLLE